MDNASQEKLKIHTAEAEPGEAALKPESAKEVRKKAAEFVKYDVDGVESQDGVENADGRVGESAGEDKKSAPTGSGKTSYSSDEIEAIRAKLLAALPPQDVMIREIRKKLLKEEKVLTKRMRSLRRKAHKHAFQLNIVVSQLRKVQNYFAMLAHATFDIIKHLWLKIVHGV